MRGFRRNRKIPSLGEAAKGLRVMTNAARLLRAQAVPTLMATPTGRGMAATILAELEPVAIEAKETAEALSEALEAFRALTGGFKA